jgi:hypothetical protein
MSLPNTANAIARGSLFPAELVPGFLNQVKGHSSLAAMCGSEPIPFNGKEYFTFNMDNDVDIVAEAGAKSAGGGQVGNKTIVPIKIEYGMRVSDEFMYGSEEVALDILRAFSEGWSKKVARGFDIMAMRITTTQISASYDLHCFNIAVSWVPTGQWKSYSFRIAANASALADLLRFKKSSSYMDNLLQ